LLAPTVSFAPVVPWAKTGPGETYLNINTPVTTVKRVTKPIKITFVSEALKLFLATKAEGQTVSQTADRKAATVLILQKISSVLW
jgi:hypothetical protein